MAGIADIVSVSIAIQDSAPKAIAFDTLLLVADAPFAGEARLYDITPAGLAAMASDGFLTWNRAYQQMSRMKGQSGAAAQAYIFGRTTNFTQALDLVPDITVTRVGYKIQFDISYKGVTSSISYTVVTNTVDAILDALEALIDASPAGLAGITTTPDNGTATKLTLIPDAAGAFIQLDGFGRELMLTETGADGSIAAQLAVAKAELGESAYGLLIDSYSEAEINLAAAFAEANDMVFLGQSADNGILVVGTTTNVASDLKTAGYHQSAVCFSRYMSGDFAAALLGRQLGQEPGTSNWAMQTLSGVSADKLNTAAHSSARGKRALTYTTDRNVAHTWDGFAASGRYFDITHGVAALKADMETRSYQVLLNAEKVGFNATGLAQLEAPVRAALTAAEGDVGKPGLIEPGWAVTMPNLQGYSTVDKAARRLKTIRWSAQMTGAVNTVEIAGTLTL
ncbi:MAG: hypothetical protein RL685_4438 [Pseudomonadota bacterium]|jgi:hypothetical protein